MHGQRASTEVKPGCWERAGKHTLEVQVSAHSVHVTGWWLVQAAVHGRLRLLQTLQSITHVAGVARTAPCVLDSRSGGRPSGTGAAAHRGAPAQLLGCPPAHRSSAQAISVLAAAPAVAILTGVAGPAAPAITLVVGQAGAGDHCAYLAAVGMLAAPATPMLAQVYHWRQRESGWTRRQEGRGVGPPTSHSCSPVHVRPSPS